MVEAAGGVVWRASETGVEVLVIHRPRRRDWSLPKGKRERGETSLECALREVHEETGLRCIAGAELPEARYRDRRGRTKRVRYWAMQAVEGRFRRNAEVDEVQWVPIDRLAGVLTHDHDLAVVAGLESALVDAA